MSYRLLKMTEMNKTKIMNHNLPNKPYKKFFGRQDAILKIKDTLLEGGTYIASIDGVGGIGKTALTYHFCQDILLPENYFSYLVWITAKDTVFDISTGTTKKVDNEFKNNSVEFIINETLKVTDFAEYILEPFETRKAFFDDIVKSEKIFFVIDNLETIQDENFFNFIREFNKFSRHNRDLKVLTTSRKRTRIADFPIEIEGLSIQDALALLDYLARNYSEKPINAILSTSEFQKVKIIEKIGRIPLGIEFIIGQLARGKNLGQIYHELEGYPSVENVKDENEKKQRLSDIIMFSFKDMYETLDEDHQLIFKTIAALQKNKKKNDNDTSFELLMSMTDFSHNQLDEILQNLIENKLILRTNNNEYDISPMSINFVKQRFEDFSEIEDRVVGLRDTLIKNPVVHDKVDLFIEAVKTLINNLQHADAEKKLINVIEKVEDYRLYFELGKVQAILKKNGKASDNFKRASELAPNNKNIWFEWINLERTSGRSHIALNIAKNAIQNSDNDISIVIQTFDVYKFRKEFDNMRDFAKTYLSLYTSQNKETDFIKLLRHWKSTEYLLLKDNEDNIYIEVVENLIKEEKDKEAKLQLLQEQLNIVKKIGLTVKIGSINSHISRIKNEIKSSIDYYVKQMNYYMSSRDLEKSQNFARIILNYSDNPHEINQQKNALRVLLQNLASKKEYDKILTYFDDYKHIGNNDENCLNTYNRALKEKLKAQRDEIISKITNNLINAENDIRKFILFCFDNKEENFLNFLNPILVSYSYNWISSWELTRDKSLNNKLPLIYYSDFSNLRRIIEWLNTNDLKRKFPKFNNTDFNTKLRKLTDNLKNYTVNERNETFHSRIAEYEIDRLNEVLVDTKRMYDIVNELIEMT